jgi:hypothetical protein
MDVFDSVFERDMQAVYTIPRYFIKAIRPLGQIQRFWMAVSSIFQINFKWLFGDWNDCTETRLKRISFFPENEWNLSIFTAAEINSSKWKILIEKERLYHCDRQNKLTKNIGSSAMETIWVFQENIYQSIFVSC